MQTRFILIGTSHPGNVGAAARAMHVMGFDDLVLVAPRFADVLGHQETLERASGALYILNKARVVGTLDEALGGVDHLCATAMVSRDFGPPTYAPRPYFESIYRNIGAYFEGICVKNTHEVNKRNNKPLITLPQAGDDFNKMSSNLGPHTFSRIAFLFGCERHGMRNEDVYRCHAALSIPTRNQTGSLNLAAAVQLIAYEWRMALDGFTVANKTYAPVADAVQIQNTLIHLAQALEHIGYLDKKAPKKLLIRLNQLLNRAQPTVEETQMLRGIAKAMLKVKPHC